MLFSFRVIIVLLTSSTSTTESRKDTKAPMWTQLSTELCWRLGRCSYPRDLLDAVAHHMYKVFGSKIFSHKSNYKFNLTRESVNVTQLCGHQQHTLEAEAQGTQQDRTTQEKTAEQEKPDCTLLTMARSNTYPNIMYMLLHCPKITTCSVVLHFMNLSSETLVNNMIQFCDIRRDRVQLFTGPCQVKKAGDCLYVITMTSDKQITLTMYKEPPDMAKQLLPSASFYRSFSGSRFLCSVHKPKGLLCFSDGKRFYHVTLISSSILLHLKMLKWSFQRFYDIIDFKINSYTGNDNKRPIAVIVQSSAVRLVFLDFDRKTIKRGHSLKMKVATASVKHGDILLHSFVIEETFSKCRTYTLKACNKE